MTDRPTTAVLALVVALAPAFGLLAPAFGLGVAAPASANAGAGAATPTQISGCTTIAEPGEYVLTRDVTNATPNAPRTGLGTCIAVRADDVTLRGDGHAVAAGGSGGQPGVVGVLVGGREPRSNVTVRNLTTTRWGGGVAALGVSGATFRNVSAVDNLGDGFFAERSPGLEVRGGTISGSNTGLFVRNAPGARLADLTVTGNLAGVSVRQSDDATLRNLSVADHSQFGVGLFRSANATLANSTLRDDGFAEVALAHSSDARLLGVSVADAPGWAVYAVRNSTAVGQRVRIGEAGRSFEVRDAALDSAADAPPLPTDRQVVGDPLWRSRPVRTPACRCQWATTPPRSNALGRPRSRCRSGDSTRARAGGASRRRWTPPPTPRRPSSGT
ncbi:right-handed parallel beta-helix repeat-containing protein [Halorussus caseinilyticus]|uniref:Right-handed parallel beta-helix repeat-containing protein n=1 Tax=Halorussus caseinilyticus TaxID=3034025 RepID=A0ABD5WNT6_9EURY|nr:right-handed parallel beta-helix repeat-containing protein [Halorussus sp. DT72]